METSGRNNHSGGSGVGTAGSNTTTATNSSTTTVASDVTSPSASNNSATSTPSRPSTTVTTVTDDAPISPPPLATGSTNNSTTATTTSSSIVTIGSPRAPDRNTTTTTTTTTCTTGTSSKPCRPVSTSHGKGGNVRIKEEPKEDVPPTKPSDPPDQGTALSDFAETTMNELLGWYGYDKVVDREDTQGLNLQRFTSRNSPARPGGVAGARGSPGEDRHDTVSEQSCDSSDIRENDNHSPGSGSEIAAHHQTLVTALTSNKSSSSCKSPNSQDSETPTGSVTTPSGGGSSSGSYIVCAWCQKPGLKLFTLKTETVTKVFCSELCFTQCRRASFKKNKVCDWCKHVRHTVNYVDFQDGEQQLQFCSDKCLNQYKMNIFCKETQEHLQLIHNPQGGDGGGPATTTPSSSDRGASGGGGGGPISSACSPGADLSPTGSTHTGSGSRVGGNTNQILITPDLWLQNGGGDDGGHGSSSRKRRRKHSSSDDIDDLDMDADDGCDHMSRDSDCSTAELVAEVKPDISRMVTVKTEISSGHHGQRDRDVLQGKSGLDRHGIGSSEATSSSSSSTRRHLKVDHSIRERIRRVRSRDSVSSSGNNIPVTIATSPGSSQLSTPPGGNNATGLTPPAGAPAALPHVPIMGALPPGAFIPPHYLPFYQQMVASGAMPAGMFPPGTAWMMPPMPPGLPAGAGLIPPPAAAVEQAKTQAQGRQGGFSRMSPTPEPAGSSSRTTASAAAPLGSGSPPPEATSSTSSSSSQQQQQHHQQHQQQPPSPAKFQGPQLLPPPPGFPGAPGMPGMAIPTGFPMPLPPGVHPAMMAPPHPTLPGGPPVTVMVPYPVMLPVPVPIPIPIPIRCDKDLRDFALIMNSSNVSSGTSSTAQRSGRSSGSSHHHHKATAAHHHHHHQHHHHVAAAGSSSSSSRPASVPLNKSTSPATLAPCSERRQCHTDDEKENSESAANCENGLVIINGGANVSNGGTSGSGVGIKYKIACACCQQSSDSGGASHRLSQDAAMVENNNTKPCNSNNINTTNEQQAMSLAELGLRPVSRGSVSSHKSIEGIAIGGALLPTQPAVAPNDDVAMDLSKDKSGSRGGGGGFGSVENPGEQLARRGTPPTTITVKSEPSAPPLIISPLQPTVAGVGGFLMPPRDHAYSSRRSMILDAPSVPRDRNESPSPEKRLMLRSPGNRDVMFAKRRCMRTRIKTK